VPDTFTGFDGRQWPIRTGNYAHITLYGRKGTREVHRFRIKPGYEPAKVMSHFLSHYKISGYKVNNDGTANDTDGNRLKIEEGKN
jgi:hypothetical protein